ncbi:uncharacterized protein SPSK_03016 [Sporothrix schenckii 1099-18]|uniref:Phosphoribosylaminoimidazole-succinocarboxamide synthase n=1 Tax=Sporothrix schenckii 1099-18 TaxID=1397361 RepID=A0A0F2LYV9_SPOSC|nr:uncharacterized protein SPSK_03016 [Sporothrix schenckii 1099-18]KJR82652.1 hypothetical protein SPSK_03016 [Sporothrix schenckii 1099-18]
MENSGRSMADQDYRPERRFYGSQDAWPLSPETPPLQTTQLPLTGNTYDKANAAAVSSEEPATLQTIVPHAPSPPSGTTAAASGAFSSSEDLYGPDRLFGPPLPRHGTLSRHVAVGPGTAQRTSRFGPTTVPPDCMGGPALGTASIAAFPAFVDPGQQFKDAVAREASNVTPGVDDTPYILYALDVLTGHSSSPTDAIADDTSGNKHSSFPFRHIPDDGLGYYRPRSLTRGAANIGTASIKLPAPLSPVQHNLDHRFSTRCDGTHGARDNQPQPADFSKSHEPRVSTTSSISTLVHPAMQPPRVSLPADHLKDSWAYLDLKSFSPQTQLVFPAPNFKPAALQPASLSFFILQCLVMTAGLIFSSMYSNLHSGLTRYSGNNYGGQFFIFRVLPQLLSVVILLYALHLSSTIIRIHPFSRMQALENPHPERRNGAIFDNLYPGLFLWPQVSNTVPWRTRLPLLTLWLTNISVPLQGSLFSVVSAGGDWRWATVQGIAWTLVVFYVCLTAAVITILIDWHIHSTGLIWDPRSIADFITLASNSNTMTDYKGSELLATRDDLRRVLRHRAIDKIGYWAWRDGRTNGIWHGIGTDLLDDAWLDARSHSMAEPPATKKSPRSWNEKLRTRANAAALDGIDLEALVLSPHSDGVRNRYLPWCLRDGPLFALAIAAFALLLALMTVSFLPSTYIKRGFPPLVEHEPTSGAFSAANFLYSFFPALLGQALFLLLASIDITVRILQPWAELSANAGGSQPSASILADYVACFSLQASWHAARNGHWRVATFSLMTTASAFIPALVGGVFMALTISTGEVRMVPNMALFAICLALLVLNFICLLTMLPGRRNFRLPHSVTCIAEILSFCANDDLMQEPSFKNAHNKITLLDQLGVKSLPTARSRWIFATGTSGDDRRLGIRRVRRYTELTNRPSGRSQKAIGINHLYES